MTQSGFRYEIMKLCWNLHSDCRPSFTALVSELDRLISDAGRSYLLIEESSIQLTEEYQKLFDSMSDAGEV
jgi:hypothetical protein